MMECAYCGRAVRESDKFCLYCGEPLLHGSDGGTGKASAGAGGATGTGSGRALFPQTASPPEDLDEPLDDGSDGGAGPEPAMEDATPARPLDIALKASIEARMELAQLAKKIDKVKARIADSLKMMEDPDFKRKYDLDDDFRKANSIRFEALKQVGEELKAQKAALEAKIAPDFAPELNNQRIRRLKVQIEELNNSFKLRKIDRKAYDALHAEYKIQLTSLLKDREILNIQLNAWIGELKLQQGDLKHQYDVLRGRKAAKEISKDELRESRESIDKRIKRIGEDIKVIHAFIFTD